jgi:hypothetical protein
MYNLKNLVPPVLANPIAIDDWMDTDPTLPQVNQNNISALSFLPNLLVAYLIELPILIFFGFKNIRSILSVCLVNLFSVLVVNFLLTSANLNNNIGWILISEILVIIFESICLILLNKKYLTYKKIIIGVTIANTISAIFGPIILSLF